MFGQGCADPFAGVQPTPPRTVDAERIPFAGVVSVRRRNDAIWMSKTLRPKRTLLLQLLIGSGTWEGRVRVGATVLLAVLVAALVPAAQSAPVRASVTRTPIKHLISLMQENHTYDNYFGTFPRGNGIPEALCLPVHPAQPRLGCVKPFHIGDNAVIPRDLDHSEATARRQVHGGRMNGFVSALKLRNQDGRLAMGYYDQRELPYYWNLASEYVLFDRFFSSALGGSFINHVYWVSGSTSPGGDRLRDEGIVDVPTIFDRLEQSGVSWKFYVQNYEPRLTYRTMHEFPGNRASQVIWVPLLNYPRFLDNPRLSRHIVDLQQYFSDLENGTLPAVSYIVPSGPSEHPPSSLTSGQAFTRTLINALLRSSAWKSSAFLLAYDDYGGWYDHVRPPQVDKHGYGLRVPALLVSPFARTGSVDSTTLDFTSILKFIEQNWGVAPLATRDLRAKSIAVGLDFTAPPREPHFTQKNRPTLNNANVRRPFIYALYGGVIVVALAPVGWVLIRRRRNETPSPRGRD
jgi:phospholipase C